MMGQTASQDQFFYAFNLEDHIPRNHLLRGINKFLDLSTLRQHLAPFYSHTGRLQFNCVALWAIVLFNLPFTHSLEM
jgi:transposase